MIKQNLSGVTLIDKKGVRVNPNIHLGESDGYISGDILDANAVQGTVNEAVQTAKEDLEDQITDLIGSAPEVLDTLAELADAIGDDPDFFNTINNELDQKVDKVSGKGLSTNDYTTEEKEKLAGIATGAEVNVQSDWSQTNNGADDYIKNKPTNVSAFTNDAGYLDESAIVETETVIDNNGHEYVDLGLPSGTLWATMNVGAASETGTGLYFQWGDISGYTADTQGYTASQVGSGDGKKAFAWADYKWSDNGSSSKFTKYNATDGKTVLDLEDDAARSNLGGQWHMPTKEQCYELLNTTYVTNAWVTDYQDSGINGLLFTSVSNGNTLFIPAAGACYGGSVNNVGYSGFAWASPLSSFRVSSAQYFTFISDGGYVDLDGLNRCYGFSVRGVIQPSTVERDKFAPNKPYVEQLLVETTYSNLVQLKNNSELVPGTWYRITDYVTTTAQSNTQSAGHAFDVIVRADSESVLNENAFAIQHEGDTYFTNQKLAAWELKYDINNDTTKYAWADATNGKGVIYYMKDENGNECPYDFKNIQFKVGAKQQAGTVANVFYFTFSVATGTDDATVTDHSLNGTLCYGNKMGLYVLSNKRSLNANVFRNTSATSSCYSNAFENNSRQNTFGNGCANNTFGNNCYNNTFGNNCYNNTFGNACANNTFGNNCARNVFANDCARNVFANDCDHITFGNECYNNTFGNGCRYITFGTSSSAKDYYKNIIFENGVSGVQLDCTQTTSSSAYCQNVLVGMGIGNKTLTVATAGNAFKTVFKTANDVEIDA